MKATNKEVKNTDKGHNEIEQPERHEMEREAIPDKEFDNGEQKEVEKPNAPEEPGHVRDATLMDLDPTFIGIDHHRKTGRMVGHEPGPENNL